MTDEFQVAIIGGGAAGIAAGLRLAEARVSYLILEARSRLGGRAWTVANEFPLDLGCGWLHSADANPWTRMAEAGGWAIDKTPPPWTRPSMPIGFPLDDQRAFGRALDDFYRRLDEARDKPDAPASSLLQPGCLWNALIDAVSTYANGAELDRLSTRDYAYYDDTWVNWRIREGYGALIAAAGANLNAMLDCPVAEINHSGRKLLVKTPKGTTRSDAIIITIPSALLAEERLHFSPGLPDKTEAAASLPLGLANKLFLSLEGAEEFEADSRIFGSTERTGTAAYHMRPFGRPVIEAFFGGKLADDLEGEGAQGYADFASYELSSLLGASFISRVRLLNLWQWRQDQFARGAYSYALPGHHGDRARLAEPVDGRLFFAGEACSIESFSTAHGAYTSGRAAAEQALASLGVPERVAGH